MTATSGAVKTQNLVTPIGLFSYPWVDRLPELSEEDKKAGKKAKHSIVIVFDAKADLTALKQAAIQVADDFFGTGKYRFPKPGDELGGSVIRSPFRRYDVADKPGYPEGGVYINARTDRKPQVVYGHAGADGKPEKIPVDKIRDEIYAGAFGRISVSAFAYNHSGNKGVSFALNNVQKTGDGERIDGRLAAEDEFTADLAQAPADLDSLV